ncbi:hypothetical protein NL676_008955 [Syzygium grande]|nr:hypothetical protein NL676_008955 [Syzygium grande]
MPKSLMRIWRRGTLPPEQPSPPSPDLSQSLTSVPPAENSIIAPKWIDARSKSGTLDSSEDALTNRVHNPVDVDDLAVPEGSGDESEEFPPPPFPELELEIKESIESLGGAIFPKLNWSSPKDAAWISSSGNLCDKTTSRPQSFFLALRKWQPALRPEMEFHHFVRNKLLVGICQREVTTFYPVLIEKDHLKVLIEDIFESTGFQPLGAFTLPLLFSWDELSEGDDEGMDFRIAESRCVVRPGLKTAVPYDYLDTSPGSGWDQFLRNADDELRRQTEESPEAGAWKAIEESSAGFSISAQTSSAMEMRYWGIFQFYGEAETSVDDIGRDQHESIFGCKDLGLDRPNVT